MVSQIFKTFDALVSMVDGRKEGVLDCSFLRELISARRGFTVSVGKRLYVLPPHPFSRFAQYANTLLF
jgi:hypothetical protein